MGDPRSEELVRIVVTIERLSDALEMHVGIVRKGRCKFCNGEGTQYVAARLAGKQEAFRSPFFAG